MSANIPGELRALHEDIYRCTRCSELDYSVQRVQPAWDPAKVHALSPRRWGMVVGQAPGVSELKQGQAMRGRAGRGLKGWLLKAGFSEQQVLMQVWPQLYKTSVTKCYPGKVGEHDRRPSRKEIAACSSFLQRQIDLVQPAVFILMGMMAVQWFFPDVLRLEQVVGHLRYWPAGMVNRAVICLPHASPGNRWLNAAENRERLQTALQLLVRLWKEAFQPKYPLEERS